MVFGLTGFDEQEPEDLGDEEDWSAEAMGLDGWELTELEDGNVMFTNPNAIGVSDDLLSDPDINDLLQPPDYPSV